MTQFLTWPDAPHNGGSLTHKLTYRNVGRASLLRHFDNGILSLVSIVKTSYWDRGLGGGPGHGSGGWVREGAVWLRPYPRPADDKSNIPEIRSAAGWGWSGSAAAENGQVISTYTTEDQYLQQFEQSFWCYADAIEYANSVEGTLLSEHSTITERARLRGYRRYSPNASSAEASKPQLVSTKEVKAKNRQGELL